MFSLILNIRVKKKHNATFISSNYYILPAKHNIEKIELIINLIMYKILSLFEKTFNI